MDDRNSQTKMWLKFSYGKFNVGHSPIVDKCLAEINEFIFTIYKSYLKVHIFGAWDLCDDEKLSSLF
jgi:hypothetical protein